MTPEHKEVLKQRQRDRMNERNKDPVRKARNNERTKAWIEANRGDKPRRLVLTPEERKERINQRARAHYQANREKILAKRAESVLTPEEIAHWRLLNEERQDT